jgi:hypothetical protein
VHQLVDKKNFDNIKMLHGTYVKKNLSLCVSPQYTTCSTAPNSQQWFHQYHIQFKHEKFQFHFKNTDKIPLKLSLEQMFILHLSITLSVVGMVSWCHHSNFLYMYFAWQWQEGYGPLSSRHRWSGKYYVYKLFGLEAWKENSIMKATAKNGG